jgi:hypothetical protein
MFASRTLLPIAWVAAGLSLSAQAPPERIQAGFKSLGTGSWESALKEWTRDGIWLDGEGKLLTKLEAQIPAPRSIGRWEQVNLPFTTALWQRHWMMATFDQGAMFFLFDHVYHKGQWHLVGIYASQDPRELLPNLDLLPSNLAQRNGQ